MALDATMRLDWLPFDGITNLIGIGRCWVHWKASFEPMTTTPKNREFYGHPDPIVRRQSKKFLNFGLADAELQDGERDR